MPENLDKLQEKVYTIDTKVSVLEEHSKNQTMLMQEMKTALKEINDTLRVYQVLKHDFDQHIAENTIMTQKFYITKDQVTKINEDLLEIKEGRDRNFQTMSRIKWIVIGTAVPAILIGITNLFFELVRRGIIK